MNAIISQGFTAHVTPLLPELAALIDAPAARPDRSLGFATIEMGTYQSAQGPVLRRYRDGRVTIDAGDRKVTGHPIGGSAPRGWWSSLTAAR